MKLNDYEQVILLMVAILVLLVLVVFFIVKLLMGRIHVVNKSTAAQGQEDWSKDSSNHSFRKEAIDRDEESSVSSWESALSYLDDDHFYEAHFAVGIKEGNGASQVVPSNIEL
ncbi:MULTISPECIES: hypothetical protein [Ehrlichia]|uniref:Uncharacterized protein n=1 Tax=Ehrlichia cf. muris str. EmCRT TaxID=1359167 RepID=A0A0F3NCX2_9RICK|nr:MULTISPECIES: hypothetical protein [Ehrlichia]KJV65581.1 hypothetical protein EMUCRT_0526 [Ehrlichia cf. muris str. EmCRT]OUC04457.1 hypothetical protein DB91_02700 [Ehrlichia sp. Wisconsin_h]